MNYSRQPFWPARLTDFTIGDVPLRDWKAFCEKLFGGQALFYTAVDGGNWRVIPGGLNSLARINWHTAYNANFDLNAVPETIEFYTDRGELVVIRAVKFIDGTIWDCRHGFRKNTIEPTKTVEAAQDMSPYFYCLSFIVNSNLSTENLK